ncbi:MAG: hypothetical protein Q8932_08315 [Bacteroidota bacterium]|nr:hypothetical protein [Bacteroidota bacterium]
MRSTLRWLLVLGIPVTYMLVLRLVFDLDIFRNFAAVMSLTFLFSLPFGSGYLIIALSSIENVRSRSYRILMPWIPILILLMITMAFAIEGWACWLMVLPGFLVLDGSYELERLRDGLYRLHLCSHFTLRTDFNFYAGWWAGWIMKDIQNNILHVIQTRCTPQL